MKDSDGRPDEIVS